MEPKAIVRHKGEGPMSNELPDWGLWTEEKLEALGSYLEQFTTASKSAKNKVYLDLFAGSAVNQARDDKSRTFDGSAVKALKTIPEFTHLRFFELKEKARSLRQELGEMFPNDDRFEVFEGDCNANIGTVLNDLKQLRLQTSPIFAFIDPRSLHFTWETLSTLADYKEPNNKGKLYKVELLILFADPDFQRLYGKDRQYPDHRASSVTATQAFGNEDWKVIAEARSRDDISVEESRYYLVELFRHQLENILKYKTTMALPFKSDAVTKKYTLVFATDHHAGKDIMKWVLGNAAEALFDDRINTQLQHEMNKRLSKGAPSLFDSPESIEDEDIRRWMSQFTVQTKRMKKDELIVSPAKMPDWFWEVKKRMDNRQDD